MVAQILRSIIIAFVALFSSKTLRAQSSPSWSYGIASHYSLEAHTLTWTSYPPGEPAQQSKNKFKPAFAVGAGIWTEKKISNVFQKPSIRLQVVDVICPILLYQIKQQNDVTTQIFIYIATV